MSWAPFKQAYVWRVLKRNPGSTNRELRTLCNDELCPEAMNNVLANMRRKGCVRQEFNHKQSRYWAIGKEPQDGTGKSFGSQVALIPNQRPAVARKLIQRALIAKGYDLKPTPTPANDACALAECWPLPSGNTRRVG